MRTRSYAVVYIPTQARVHLGWMGQKPYEAHYDRCQVDLEDGQTALRKLQAELASTTQYLLVPSYHATTSLS